MYVTAILILLLLLSCKKEAFSKTNTLYEGYVDYTNIYNDHIHVQGDFKYEANTYRKKGRQYTMNYLTFDSDTLDISVSFYYNHSKNEISNATMWVEATFGSETLAIKGSNENGSLFFGVFSYVYMDNMPSFPMIQRGSIYLTPKK